MQIIIIRLYQKLLCPVCSFEFHEMAYYVMQMIKFSLNGYHQCDERIINMRQMNSIYRQTGTIRHQDDHA